MCHVYYTCGLRFREGGLLFRDAGLIFACKRPYLDEIYKAEIEKIKSIFLSILWDIKKDIDSGKQPEKTATAAMLQGVQDEIRERSQEHLSKDDVADIVVNQFGLASKMNEKSISLFKKLMKGMMK